MRYSLRRTAVPLHLVYGAGQGEGGSLIGRRFMLDVEGRELMLSVDLALNFQGRYKSTGPIEAEALMRNRSRLRAIQCDDNLVRTRLVRAWEELHEPRLTALLDLGERGRLLYAVRPHLRFMGGVQLEVLKELDLSQALPLSAEEAA